MSNETATSQWAAAKPLGDIAYGHQSHDWMASKVRMLRRDDLDHEAVCVGARDRIVWLSARVAELESHFAGAAKTARSEQSTAHNARAPVQGYHGRNIPWEVHGLAWEAYARKYGRGQSAEQLANRGGFGILEMDEYLPDWRKRAAEIDSRFLSASALVDALKEMRSYEYRRGDLIHQTSLEAKCKCARCIEERADAAITSAAIADAGKK